MKWITDIFSGNGGSQAQGPATTAGAGDGGKKDAIDAWLGRITGVYSAVTGAGQKGGPAPSAAQAPAKTNFVPYAIGGVVLVGLLWFLFKKK